MNWQISGNEVWQHGQQLARFPYPIKETKQLGDVLVVLLQLPADVVFPENVFGIELTTGRQWQIESQRYYQQASPETCFVAIAPEAPEGLVSLSTWGEQMVDVDYQTGRIVRVESLR
jgi:hypothetical protein